MDIKAVLFDCDGTMFDTEIVSQRMWQETAVKYGITLPDDFFLKITGGGLFNQFYEIPGFEQYVKDMMKKRMDCDFWGSINKDCLNKKGLIELFTYLKDNGYKIGICSSSPEAYVKTLLTDVSIDLPYDVMICGDKVKEKKPSPEIFLTAANILNIKPENILVVEDSKNGIIAATKAHMHHCFIFDTIKPDDELKDMLEFEKDSMDEIIPLLESFK